MTRPDPPSFSGHPKGRPLVSAVIVNFNSWPDVVRLVDSLAASAEVASGLAEIVVVDNHSDSPPPTDLDRPGGGVRLVLRDDNGGFAVGVNAGWHASRGRWLLLINPDVTAGDELLREVVTSADGFEAEGPDAPGIVGYALKNPDGSRQPSVGIFPSLGRVLGEVFLPRSRRKYRASWRTVAGPVDWVTGACVLVNTAVLEALGGLDEEFFLYYEEVALCHSARRLGWRIEYDPSVEVVHLRPLQNRPVSPRMRVITRHSKLLYFRKHLPQWQFLGLCGVVAVEARIRGLWARVRSRSEESRAWSRIADIERALRHGARLGGSQVRELAESVSRETARTA